MLKRSIHSSFAAIAMCLATEAAARNPVIGTDQPQPVTSISREQLDSLPAGRRIEDLIRTCPANTFPTVTRDPQAIVDGQLFLSSPSLACLTPPDVEMIEVYKIHNAIRAKYGAPPLARDPALEISSGSHAGQLERAGKLFHAPREGRGNIRENISQGLPSWSARQLMGGWLKEKKNFVPGTFPNVSRTGNWWDIAHWTQMIWVRTVMIGCARAAGIGASWMVCRYGPGGNRDGELVGVPPARPYLVEAPKLPPAEVFGHKQASATADRPVGDIGTSLLELYDIGPLTADWSSLFEYGPAGVTNPGGTASDGPRGPSLFDLGIYSGGAWSTDWFELTSDEIIDDPIGTKVVQPDLGGKAEMYRPNSSPKSIDPGTVSLLSAYARAAAKLGDVTSLQGYAREARQIVDGIKSGKIHFWWPAQAEKVAKEIEDMLADAIPVQTSVDQPQLPTKEVFKPDPPSTLEDPM